MKELQKKINTTIELMGFGDFRIDADEQSRRISITINDSAVSQENLPFLVLNISRIARLMAKQLDRPHVFIDVNNYRKEREGLIIKLARASATKVAATGEPVSLPVMNAYERRLVHSELSMRPDVETESAGENRERHVVVKPI